VGKVLVLYHSASGNTATMAALVAEGAGAIPGTEVRVREIDEASPDDVYWCDGLAGGSPTNMGVLSWRMKRFWDEAMFDHWGKVACAFSSSGGCGGGRGRHGDPSSLTRTPTRPTRPGAARPRSGCRSPPRRRGRG